MKRTGKLTALMLSAALVAGTLATLGSAADAGPREKGERERSPMARLARVMKKLDLRSDQRVAVESLAKDMKAKAAPMRKLRKQGMEELARGVRAGKLDKVRAEQLMAQAKAQAKALKPDFIASLNKLHSILDQEQRAELVNLIKKKHRRHFRGKHRGKMRKISKKLGLSDDQKDKIQDTMYSQFKKHRGEMRGEWGKKRTEMKAAAEAFKSDSFDARSLSLFQKAPGFMKHKGQKMMAFAEAVLPVLTEAQRDQLATMIETRAARKGGARSHR